MAEYVERKALRDVLYDEDAVTMRGVAIINNFPAADVAPVVHGRWEETDWIGMNEHGDLVKTAKLRCSNCKNCFEKKLLWKQNFCPECGARMTEDGKE